MVVKKRRKKACKKDKSGLKGFFADIFKDKKKRKKTKVKTKKKRGSLWYKVILFVLFVGVVAGILGGGFLWYCKESLPDISKALYVERARGVKILSVEGKEITSYGGNFSKPVKVDELPEYVYRAIIDTEDRRFYKHKGIDYIGLFRAVMVNLVKRRYAQGASTLTQQVAKNLFLTREKSIKRKVQEYILAKKLEESFSKNQILEIYLNRVFFGYGAYGINSAARRYFNKDAKELNLKEAAILAGSLKAPSRYNYFSNKELAEKRAEVVLGIMLRAGTLSKEEVENAKKLKVNDGKNEVILGGRYFGDYVMEELSGILSDDGYEDIYVKTTLDWNLQQRAEYLMRKNLRENKKNNVSEGAVVILDKDGAVKAMSGGFDYKKSQFNRAVQARRQAGSSFKLFVYLAAFEKGFGVDELISDEALDIDGWEPKNYDKKYRGAVKVRDAFASSLNVATVDLATYVGLDNIIEMAYRLGVSDEIKRKPAIILGATEVKVIDMARAYGAVFNGGYEVYPFVIEKIYNTDNEVIYQHEKQEKRRVLDDEVVKKAKVILRDVVTNGTGKGARSVKNAFGKTGTTQNYRDAWFVGFDDKYVGAVWVGNDDNKSMKEVTGGGMAVKIWADIFKR